MISTPDELLNDVLQYYADSGNARPFATINDATRDFDFRHNPNAQYRFLGNLRENMISKVVDKLFRDKYLTVRNPHPDPDQVEYTITFEGMIFIDNGGYVSAFEKAQSQKKNQILKDWLLILGSCLAGIGAIAVLIVPLLKLTYNTKASVILMVFGIALGAIMLLLGQELVRRKSK